MEKPIQNIVIVGGGTAGWITAGMLAAEFSVHSKKEQNIHITLVESPDIKTIGVGEGTWPSMRNTLIRIGITESEFISACDASFKQGSKFVHWTKNQSNDEYYHPFMEPDGYTQTNLYQAWKQDPINSFAKTLSVQAHICEENLAPKQFATPEYASVTNYGYHLDAAKFATLLQRHCINKLNVTHIIDHMVKIESSNYGDISAILTKKNNRIKGDLFIDCTGSASLLLGKHYNVPFISQNHILFNDSALAAQVDYPHSNSTINSATISTAQTSGWIWDIGLPTRRGIGHTYSSTHISDDEAAQQLITYISRHANAEQAHKIIPKKLTFTPGYREKFWHNNCVAIGMSAGFLEPLEASALAMIELNCTMLVEEFPVNRQHMNIIANRFNERFTYRWQRTIEFLKLHYVLSQRRDSRYWRDNQLKESIPPRLQELLTLWQYQVPSRYDFVQNEEIFPSASYQFILYGMGFNTKNNNSKQSNDIKLAEQIFTNNKAKIQQYKAGLPNNRELINYICQQFHKH